ncbi:unnamed protein product [Adineta ricciae]|uniref:Uncharacterized protein n=1 Tax=Adineta ricciae TaxID=249248 RepID=A0A814S134_ADIRI|nr:unnamed protein product [Adineta ricciae]
MNEHSEDNTLPLLTSCEHLSTPSSSYDHVTELNLSNLQLMQIDTFPFEQFPHLRSLNLSHNQLTFINPDWTKSSTNTIEYLNLSSNKLQTLLFLRDFKYLQTLDITDNLLGKHERFLVLDICPALQHIIDFNEEQIHHDQVKFNHLLTIIESGSSTIDLHNFRQRMIDRIEQEDIYSEFSRSPLGNYIIDKRFNKLSMQMETSLTNEFNFSLKISANSKDLFQPIKLLRAHHQANSELRSLAVHMCAFEPNTSENILATCGGYKVCFTNCDTCEITHLFEVNTLSSVMSSTTGRKTKNKKKITQMDHFTCLCWIEINHLNEDPLKILAVGATNGSIYLLLPKWKLMFAHIELPNSSIGCLTWSSNDPYLLAIGSYHTVRFINIRSYIDRVQSFIHKQSQSSILFDCDDTSMFVNKVSTTHVYNLYEGIGPLINITDLLFYPLSRDRTVLLVSTTSGLFLINYQEKQCQSPVQLALPKSIWTVSEHIVSLRLIAHPIRLVALNILDLDQIYCFNLEQALENQQVHIHHTFSNPYPQSTAKLAVFSKVNMSAECILSSQHGAFYYHRFQSNTHDQQVKIFTLPNILSADMNESYLCLTTNTNLICIYKR